MKVALTLLLVFAVIQNTIAQDVTVTVFDVGAGVCILGEFPNEADSTDSYYMVYDAGGFSCDDNIQAVVPVDEQIDLMVLSHNDTDHIATLITSWLRMMLKKSFGLALSVRILTNGLISMRPLTMKPAQRSLT